MPRQFSLPFKTVIGSEVAPGPWHYRIGNGDWLRMGPSIPGWDYLAPLELHREISIDTRGVKTACGLNDATDLQLVVTLSSAIARFRRVVVTQAVPEDKGVSTLTFRVPSAELAGRLLVETEIVLQTTSRSSDPFAARLAGSRLFTESCPVDLEGSSSRMPLEVATFSHHLPALNAPRAPWHVECGTGDLQLPVMHELRVYLNANCKAIVEPILKGDRNLLTLLKAEIARRLLEMALADEMFLDGQADFCEGSIGQAAWRIMQMCFSHMRTRDVHVLASRQPAQFEAMIRSRFMSYAE